MQTNRVLGIAEYEARVLGNDNIKNGSGVCSEQGHGFGGNVRIPKTHRVIHTARG